MYRAEELRIVSDELFLAVQQRLAKLKTGRRGPNKRKDISPVGSRHGYFSLCKVRCEVLRCGQEGQGIGRARMGHVALSIGRGA